MDFLKKDQNQYYDNGKGKIRGDNEDNEGSKWRKKEKNQKQTKKIPTLYLYSQYLTPSSGMLQQKKF